MTPVAGTKTHTLWDATRKYLLGKGAIMRDGLAPMSNQERLMDTHLEKITQLRGVIDDV